LIPANDEQTITLVGLTCGTTYHYTIRVQDLAYNRWNTADLTFTTLACDGTPDILNLLMSNVTNDSATINRASDVIPDTADYRIKTNTSSFTSWLSLWDEEIIEDLSASTTYIVEIRLGIGDNYSTDSISFTTASAANGIVVTSQQRILNGNDPTVWGWYASWYHFRFGVTINNLNEIDLQFKLANRSNGASTMAVANNALVKVTANGTNDYSTWITLTGTSYTDIDTNISDLDNNTNLWWRQIYIDLFYKIPTGAGGVYTTTYGINADSVE
jgi:hypothetical protein